MKNMTSDNKKSTNSKVNKKPFYTLEGKAIDVETIIRLRKWMEDEVISQKGMFSRSYLLTDYDAKQNIFSFKLQFFK